MALIIDLRTNLCQKSKISEQNAHWTAGFNHLIGENQTAVLLNLILGNVVAAFICNVQEAGFRINTKEAREISHGGHETERRKLSTYWINCKEGDAIMATVGYI